MKNNVCLHLNFLCEDNYTEPIGETIYLQDATHIGTKLRNRLLKTSIHLPFGNKTISVSHLKMLLKIPKDIHGLAPTDILPDDRQNYKSLEKVMTERVSNALKNTLSTPKRLFVILIFAVKPRLAYLKQI